ncbi:MAG: DoxX family protein [Pseudonocardiaceae bacterium]
MSASLASTPQSRKATTQQVILWVVQVLVAALFLFAGGTKLIAAPPMVELFDTIGFGQWFMYLTGALEVIGAVALLIPRFIALGALLLAGVMVGAVITNLAIGENPVPAVVLLVITAIITWARRDRLTAALGR